MSNDKQRHNENNPLQDDLEGAGEIRKEWLAL